MKKALSRRTILRGIGASVALPLLESMVPALQAAPAPIRRVAFIYTPTGIIMNSWTPAAEGAGFEFTPTLKPLEPFRYRVNVLSGLEHHNGESLGDGAGDHARAGATWLTGVHPKKTEGADIHNGISVDQILAKEIGGGTSLPSLELGLEDVRMVGGCDSGYSCAYSNTISWGSPTTPIPYEINPRAVFERLFGDGETTDPAARAIKSREDRSILDFVLADANRISTSLGAADRRKMSDYLDSVREIERRIQQAESKNATTLSLSSLPALDRPDGIPPTFEEHIQLMFDLMTVAFQADLTRVVTFMYSREGGNRTYPEIGVPDAHHGLSHHQNDPAKIARLQLIDHHHVAMLSYLLGKLQAAKDGDGTLLDHSTLVYGSSLSDSNRHLHDNLPVLFMGGANRAGRHIRYPKGTPMTNLYLTMLDGLGVHPEKIGDSTGKLEHLTDL
jgi:hypothetical protein